VQRGHGPPFSYGVELDAIHAALNIFMTAPVRGDSRIEVIASRSTAGDRVALRARIDGIAGLIACSAHGSNGSSFARIDYAAD
jgi:uncharacterized protein YcgI (DUF1989 family)